MQIAYQANQSKISQGTEQLKVPETSQTTLVHKSKLNQNEQKSTVNTSRLSVQAQGSRHVSQSTYKTNRLVMINKHTQSICIGLIG